MTEPVSGKRARGLVRVPNKDALIRTMHRNHYSLLRQLVDVPMPAAYDSRSLGLILTPIDQGQCGDCWLESGIGVMETALVLAKILPADGTKRLSDQYFLDCGRSGGCNGDDNVTAIQWGVATGFPTAADYGPYEAKKDRCHSSPSMTMHKILDWGFASSSGDCGMTCDQDIKAAVLRYGCVGCAIAADDAFENNPAGVVFQGSGSTEIDHDVEIVGWDDSKGAPGKTAWILKNSWGTSWCDGGYCWIVSGANLVGTESVWATALPQRQRGRT
jgi:cathepsin L